MKRRSKSSKAKELLILYNSLEPRKIKLSTLKRKMISLGNGDYHVIGRAHNYTV